MNVIKKRPKVGIYRLTNITFAAFKKKMIIMEKNSNLPSRLKTVDHGHSME